MNKKNLSASLNQAISALQCVANELKREECQCKSWQQECERKARIAAERARQKRFCGCVEEFGPVFARPAHPVCPPAPRRVAVPAPCGCPQPAWGVAGQPAEDKNKVFGINVRIDEPRAQDYNSRWAFERDHAKFDRLVEAAEACTWKNKSNTAPLHKVNAIRRNICEGPVMGVNLVGETQWWD